MDINAIVNMPISLTSYEDCEKYVQAIRNAIDVYIKNNNINVDNNIEFQEMIIEIATKMCTRLTKEFNENATSFVEEEIIEPYKEISYFPPNPYSENYQPYQEGKIPFSNYKKGTINAEIKEELLSKVDGSPQSYINIVINNQEIMDDPLFFDICNSIPDNQIKTVYMLIDYALKNFDNRIHSITFYIEMLDNPDRYRSSLFDDLKLKILEKVYNSIDVLSPRLGDGDIQKYFNSLHNVNAQKIEKFLRDLDNPSSVVKTFIALLPRLDYDKICQLDGLVLEKANDSYGYENTMLYILDFVRPNVFYQMLERYGSKLSQDNIHTIYCRCQNKPELLSYFAQYLLRHVNDFSDEWLIENAASFINLNNPQLTSRLVEKLENQPLKVIFGILSRVNSMDDKALLDFSKKKFGSYEPIELMKDITVLTAFNNRELNNFIISKLKKLQFRGELEYYMIDLVINSNPSIHDYMINFLLSEISKMDLNELCPYYERFVGLKDELIDNLLNNKILNGSLEEVQLFVVMICNLGNYELIDALIDKHGCRELIQSTMNGVKDYNMIHYLFHRLYPDLADEHLNKLVDIYYLTQIDIITLDIGSFEEVCESFEESTGMDIAIFVSLTAKSRNRDLLAPIFKMCCTDKKTFKRINELLSGIDRTDNNMGVKQIIDCYQLFSWYPELINDICNTNRELTEDEKLSLSYLVKFKLDGITSLESLANVDKAIDNEISDGIKYANDINELKDLFLRYFLNISLDDYLMIVDNAITRDTLNRILNEDLSKDQRRVVELLEVIISFLSETINSTNDMDSLKALLNGIDSQEKRSKLGAIFSIDIVELIRRVYEIDSQVTLTNLSDLPEELYNQESGYYDLSQSEYTLYAHVTSFEHLEGLVNPKIRGTQFICLSAISDLMVKGFYSAGITVLFDRIPTGGFIASSPTNTGSNGIIGSNNYELNTLRYHQNDVRSISSTYMFDGSSHSETDVFRKGMVPAGILVRGNEPTTVEREAAARLSELIGKEIPLIKVQGVGKKIENPKPIKDNAAEKEKEESESKDKLKDFQEVRSSALQSIKERLESLKAHVKIDNIVDLTNVKNRTGASHDLFKCTINGEEYFLKPGTSRGGKREEVHRVYANKLGYDIQMLVHPEGAIPVIVEDVNLGRSGYEGSTKCAAIKIMPGVRDFANLDQAVFPNNGYEPLNESQVESLCMEFIVDYLLFSQDVKGANFITDGTRVYGIDKEQSLKYALGLDHTMDYRSGPGSGKQTMYANLFDAYTMGMQPIPDYIFDNMLAKAYEISQMNNEAYLKYFEDYINCQPEQSREALKNKVLERKSHVYEQALNMCESLKSQRGVKYGK